MAERRRYLNLDGVSALKSERLRNFILCTNEAEEEVWEMLEKARPDLLSEEPSKSVSLSSLLMAEYHKIPTRIELSIRGGGTVLDAYKRTGLPIGHMLGCQSACDAFEASSDQRMDYTLAEIEVYDGPENDILDDDQFDQLKAGKVIGDLVVFDGNSWVIIYLPDTSWPSDNQFIGLAPATLICRDVQLIP